MEEFKMADVPSWTMCHLLIFLVGCYRVHDSRDVILNRGSLHFILNTSSSKQINKHI